jgi:hypothetical protein
MTAVKNKRKITTLFFFLLLLAPSLSLEKTCPLGLRNGTCDSTAKCAIFEGDSNVCVGWSHYLCGTKQYRDLKTCSCVNCPSGSGASCEPLSECCSLLDCGRIDPAAKATEKPRALSAAPPRAAHAASGMLLAVTLVVGLGYCQGRTP